jgi:hypothetical protein
MSKEQNKQIINITMNLIDKDAVIAKIQEMVDRLQQSCNPNPLGSIQECLAAAEIEALKCVLDSINAIEAPNLYHDAKDANDNPDEYRDILLITHTPKGHNKYKYSVGKLESPGNVMIRPWGSLPLHIFDKWVYLDELVRLS